MYAAYKFIQKRRQEEEFETGYNDTEELRRQEALEAAKSKLRAAELDDDDDDLSSSRKGTDTL